MDRLEAVGDRELRQALLYARSRPAPVTADELADAEGIHRNVARARLERLAAAGLLEPGFERRSGRTGPGAGRPAKTYAVRAELSAIEFPQRRYERLIALLIETLPAGARPETLREVGVAFGRELAEIAALRPATTLPAAAESICAALGRIGYQAAVDQVGAGEASIHTPMCPLRPLVVETADATQVDRGMWAGLAAAALAGVAVERIACESRDCLDGHGSCRVRLSLDP